MSNSIETNDVPLTVDELGLLEYLKTTSKVERIEERVCVPSFPGDSIYLQSFVSSGSSGKVHVIFVHGLGDYGGRQAWKARYLVERGFDCTLYDHVGHGRSSGVRGLVPSVEQLIGTLDYIIQHVSTKYSTDRILLVGESMGGLACLLHAIEYPKCKHVKGMFLVAPFIRGHGDSMPNAVLRFLARWLAFLVPWLPAASANKGNNHSDPKVEQEFNNDIGTYCGWLRVGTGNMFLEALELVKAKVPSTDFSHLKMLIAHGNKDRVADLEGSQWLAEFISFSPKNPEQVLWTIPNGEHVLYADFRNEILERLVQFCSSL